MAGKKFKPPVFCEVTECVLKAELQVSIPAGNTVTLEIHLTNSEGNFVGINLTPAQAQETIDSLSRAATILDATVLPWIEQCCLTPKVTLKNETIVCCNCESELAHFGQGPK